VIKWCCVTQAKETFFHGFLPRMTIAPVQDTSKRHQGQLVNRKVRSIITGIWEDLVPSVQWRVKSLSEPLRPGCQPVENESSPSFRRGKHSPRRLIIAERVFRTFPDVDKSPKIPRKHQKNSSRFLGATLTLINGGGV
jgi:hypothetical protein